MLGITKIVFKGFPHQAHTRKKQFLIDIFVEYGYKAIFLENLVKDFHDVKKKNNDISD